MKIVRNVDRLLPDARAARISVMMADPDPWWKLRIGGLVDLIEKVKPRTVLEIGCCRGHSTEVFLLYAERVVALDPWPSPQDDPDYAKMESLAGDEFAEFTARCMPYPGLEIIRGRSPDDVPIGPFDLIYIDGDHRYEAVKADIAATRGRCRVLAGHDFNIPSVMCAVLEYGVSTRSMPHIFSDSSWMFGHA